MGNVPCHSMGKLTSMPSSARGLALTWRMAMYAPAKLSPPTLLCQHIRS